LGKLKELLQYNPASGKFHWNVDRTGGVKAGDEAGAIDSQGYVKMTIGGRQYKGHRVAWFYVHGVWPKAIDHINGIRDDNRIGNIRECSIRENTANRTYHRAGKLVGVCWSPKRQKWRSTIQINGKQTHLGFFDTPEKAHARYVEERSKI
jgi:hypothetical protein